MSLHFVSSVVAAAKSRWRPSSRLFSSAILDGFLFRLRLLAVFLLIVERLILAFDVSIDRFALYELHPLVRDLCFPGCLRL